MSSFTIKPKVDQIREFMEIASDFTNPLELIREAISNSFDAKASFIRFKFSVEKEYGEDNFIVFIEDDGIGMNLEQLQAFFDLGNSTNRGNPDAIGEKGHGTKVYFNSSEIEVITSKGEGNIKYKALLKNVLRSFYDNIIPDVEVTELDNKENWRGTRITIKGYNHNRRDKFTHERIKDYILCFTKVGSCELEFGIDRYKNFVLFLQGIGEKEEEKIGFGHKFPKENKDVEKLFDKKGVLAPKWYVKRWIKQGHLPNFPDKKYNAVFYVEGDDAKRDNNPMLRRSGYTAPEGAYQVRQRYGLWLCKDFIPITQKNEWIVTKGTEFVRFHAFINIQDFKLTANRGSVDNTPSEIMNDLELVVRNIYKDITTSEDWEKLEWLEGEISGVKTEERERDGFETRIKRTRGVRVAHYQGYTLVEPVKENKYYSEQGVYSIFLILNTIEPNLFPFEIVDFDTHDGIDVIARGHSDLTLDKSQLFYVEFKSKLTSGLNHSFKYLSNIVCWDTDILDGGTVTDTSGEERTMKIISANDPDNHDKYTKYFLDAPASPRRVEVIVLKDYLNQKLGIEFRPR